MSSLLSVKDITFQHCANRLWFKPEVTFNLNPVSFNINRGEIISIIGSNNSGKSTLAHLLTGGKTPLSGEIRLDGRNLASMSPQERCCNIRIMFQHATEALNPALTLREMLDHALALNTVLSKKQREIKILKTIQQVGLLTEHASFYRNMMSDGQRQRAALARALILDPKVIVADEPFAALDPSVRSQTVNFIMQLCHDRGLAFVIISSNLGIVRHISDKVLVLHRGNIIESGRTDTVFNWPKQPYTKRLLQTYKDLTRTD